MDAGGGGVSAALAPAPFLSKTYDMVDDPSTDAVVSWGSASNTFVVWNVAEFGKDLLPKYFKHSNFSSFVRQLNTYGFRKVDPDRWEFANDGFLKGHRHLLKTIIRRKPSHAQPNPQSPLVQNPPTEPCAKARKGGIEEEVEMLKKDKNVLMHELVRLRHQQQSTDSQLQTMGQRVHGMEQRQQQMMSFLAKAVQSPGFMSQLVNNDGPRKISHGSKKRRLPGQDEENLVQKYGIVTPDGQVVKYQPLMNEAAKSMLRQILKINNAPGGRLERKLSNSNSFLIDSAQPMDNKISGVILSEVLPHTSALTEIQPDNLLPNFVPSHEITLDNNIGIYDESFMGEQPTVLGCGDINTISGCVDAQMAVASDELLADREVDILLDDIQNLPGINDVFWEQFLSGSPVHGDTDDVNSSKDHVEQGVDWDNKLKSLNNLTEQMGLLTSVSKS
ncbi:Heat stress transcription factor A-1b [Striga hermonthica]|uniref:Heat stress transcription factor n=1 Tax=Striga hermonthica TaxID=68872 RepID=A0A9N7N251_STRHE|nr:Heat stress transcription factor A-1b [Striga hermonthica]